MLIKKIMIKSKKYSRSFSLIEVLVFTTVLSLFFVTAAAVATFNIRNTKIQENKILATRYAEEATEWVRFEKESDWSVFVAHDASGTGTTYCLNNLAWTSASACGEVYSLGTPSIFKRELFIKNSGPDQVDTTVTVSWKEINGIFSVPIKTVFKLLE